MSGSDGWDDGDGAIEARGLTKHFGDVVTVDDLELRIEQGTVYGFLGPNGSGNHHDVHVDDSDAADGGVRPASRAST